jgi:hypothetical protein
MQQFFQPRKPAMKSVNRWFLVVALLLASLLAGCASVPMTSAEDDARAKSFVVQKDKASIYVYRNESLGGAIPMTVSLNGKVAGQSGMQTFFLFEVEPGAHEVGSIAENTTSLKLQTEAGKAYYVWQEVKMGMWMARSQLQQVDEPAGRKAVLECKRVRSNF